jgi:hypothetical protein
MQLNDYLRSTYLKTEERMIQFFQTNPGSFFTNNFAGPRYCLRKRYYRCLELFLSQNIPFFNFCLSRMFNVRGEYGTLANFLFKMRVLVYINDENEEEEEEEDEEEEENEIAIFITKFDNLLGIKRIFGNSDWQESLFGQMFLYGMIRTENRASAERRRDNTFVRYEIFPLQKSFISELQNGSVTDREFLSEIIEPFPLQDITEHTEESIQYPMYHYIDMRYADDILTLLNLYSKMRENPEERAQKIQEHLDRERARNERRRERREGRHAL